MDARSFADLISTVVARVRHMAGYAPRCIAGFFGKTCFAEDRAHERRLEVCCWREKGKL